MLGVRGHSLYKRSQNNAKSTYRILAVVLNPALEYSVQTSLRIESTCPWRARLPCLCCCMALGTQCRGARRYFYRLGMTSQRTDRPLPRAGISDRIPAFPCLFLIKEASTEL